MFVLIENQRYGPPFLTRRVEKYDFKVQKHPVNVLRSATVRT